MELKQKIINFLKWSERYTGTNMVYIAKGGLWLIFGKIFLVLCSFLVMIVFARFLSKEIYGTYKYILSVTGILAIFTLPGMDSALIRSVAQGKEGTIFLCFKEKIKWGAIGGIISLAISIYYFLRENSILGTSFLIAAFFLPVMDAFFLFQAFWQGKKRFDVQNKFLIYIQAIATAFLILVILFTKNLFFILFTYFASYTLLRAFFFKITSKKLENQEKEIEAISFGKHLSLMTIPGLIGENLDKILIWKFLGPIPVAIYSFALLPVIRVREAVPISPLALPKLSQRNLSEIKKYLLKKFYKIFLFSIPLTIIYILLAPYIFKIFLPAYLDSVPYTQVLALILAFTPFSLIGTSLIAQMKKRELYLISFLGPSLKIILFFVLLPVLGIWGAVLAILITHIFNSGLLLYLFKNI